MAPSQLSCNCCNHCRHKAAAGFVSCGRRRCKALLALVPGLLRVCWPIPTVTFQVRPSLAASWSVQPRQPDAGL